jgi:hypothetical protein
MKALGLSRSEVVWHLIGRGLRATPARDWSGTMVCLLNRFTRSVSFSGVILVAPMLSSLAAGQQANAYADARISQFERSVRVLASIAVAAVSNSRRTSLP